MLQEEKAKLGGPAKAAPKRGRKPAAPASAAVPEADEDMAEEEEEGSIVPSSDLLSAETQAGLTADVPVPASVCTDTIFLHTAHEWTS